MKIRHFPVVCFTLWALLFPYPARAETEYMAVFMEGKKVGHAIETRTVASGQVTTTEQIEITLSRVGVPMTITATQTSVETADGRPLSFDSVQQLGAMTMRVEGAIKSPGKVSVVTNSLGQRQESTIDWPEGAVMSEGFRLLTQRMGLKQGTQYKARLFSPEIMDAVDAEVSVGAKQPVDLLGRVVTLTEVTTTMSMPGTGRITTTSYVNDDLIPLKTLMPLAGLKVELVSCAKEFALGPKDVLDVIDKMFVKSPQPLGDLQSAAAITYRLRPNSSSGDPLILPETDNQKVTKLQDGALQVVVQPIRAPAKAEYPYKGKDAKVLEALKSTAYLQSDRREIIELARKAVGQTKDAAEAAKKIEAFVAGYIENSSLSVGYASAAEVAASRKGDCSEFAVLTAALCRAVGIPAQVVAGIAYVDDYAGFQGFGGHEWTQAYVGDKWVSLDAAFKSGGRGGYDAGHIALAVGNGEPADFFNMATTLGQFTIDKVEVKRTK